MSRARAAGRALGRLWSDERATLSVEAVIVMPVLLWTLLAILVFWDGFRASAATVKAAYAVSDLVSRERSALDQGYLDGMRGVLDAMSRAGQAGDLGRDGAGSLRMSVARSRIDSETEDAAGDTIYETTLVLDWSHASGSDLSPVTSIDEIRAHIPELAPGDQLMVIEAHVPWSPPVVNVIPARAMTSVAITRHRFGQRMCWESC